MMNAALVKGQGSQKGFSAMELILVIALIGILSAIAVPSFLQWRQNMLYREAARDIALMLRDARNKAIALNRQHRVEFDLAVRQYGLRTGNRAYNTDWADTAANPLTGIRYVTLPDGVTVNVAPTAIAFNSNGTAQLNAPYTISVLDTAAVVHFRITVDPAGRIRVR